MARVLIVADGCVFTVTMWVADALQPAVVVTVTEKTVVELTVGVIVCVVSPVDQLYVAKPAPASRAIVPLPQTKFGPLIDTVGFGLTVTATGEDVALQPAALMTVTLKLPDAETTIDCVVAPFDHE